jgi:hypothetical protein
MKLKRAEVNRFLDTGLVKIPLAAGENRAVHRSPDYPRMCSVHQGGG